MLTVKVCEQLTREVDVHVSPEEMAALIAGTDRFVSRRRVRGISPTDQAPCPRPGGCCARGYGSSHFRIIVCGVTGGCWCR